MHWALYIVTFVTTLAGWMLAGSHRTPVDIKMFGLIDMPQIVSPGSPLHEPLEEVHEYLAFTLIALVVLHAAAALYHHFVFRDNMLVRMIANKPRHGT